MLRDFPATCEIVFHTSGQSAASVDHFWIVPDDIKAMASWVLARCCVFGKGGMVTKGLKNTIDAITADPSVHIFPDPPLRKMTDRSPPPTYPSRVCLLTLV